MQDDHRDGSGLSDATRLHPVTLVDGSPHEGTDFLSAAIDHPNIEVGA